jgi:hypothetical protein
VLDDILVGGGFIIKFVIWWSILRIRNSMDIPTLVAIIFCSMTLFVSCMWLPLWVSTSYHLLKSSDVVSFSQTVDVHVGTVRNSTGFMCDCVVACTERIEISIHHGTAQVGVWFNLVLLRILELLLQPTVLVMGTLLATVIQVFRHPREFERVARDLHNEAKAIAYGISEIFGPLLLHAAREIWRLVSNPANLLGYIMIIIVFRAFPGALKIVLKGGDKAGGKMDSLIS